MQVGRIINAEHFIILWAFCCICQGKCLFIWIHTCAHTYACLNTCTFSHIFICTPLCVEGYVNDRDTYGYQIVYSVLTCQVCLSSITCGQSLCCEQQWIEKNKEISSQVKQVVIYIYST